MVRLSSPSPPAFNHLANVKLSPMHRESSLPTPPSPSSFPTPPFPLLAQLLPDSAPCPPCSSARQDTTHGLYCPWLQGSAGSTDTPWAGFVADPCQFASSQPPSCLLLQPVLREPHMSPQCQLPATGQLLFTTAAPSQSWSPLVKPQSCSKLFHGLDSTNTSLLLLLLGSVLCFSAYVKLGGEENLTLCLNWIFCSVSLC